VPAVLLGDLIMLPAPGLAALRAIKRGLVRFADEVIAPATHPWRRARALRRLARFDGMAVTFVCYGNICRSPYAELRMRELGRRNGGGLSVSSAGFYGPGRPSPDRARDVARRRGVDLTAHRSRSLSDVPLERTLVVVMERWHARAARRQNPIPAQRLVVLGDLDPVREGSRTIADPYGMDEAVFDACFDRIDRCVDVLAAALVGRSR
jgi:protein-tyrosine-phosphatase